jgi:hypothetical protein
VKHQISCILEHCNDTQSSEIALASCRKFCFEETRTPSRLLDDPYSFTRLKVRFSQSCTQQYSLCFTFPKETAAQEKNFSIPIVNLLQSGKLKSTGVLFLTPFFFWYVYVPVILVHSVVLDEFPGYIYFRIMSGKNSIPCIAQFLHSLTVWALLPFPITRCFVTTSSEFLFHPQ